jgi:hypothetical protein
MKYLLDSNVFIEAKRLHYGFDFYAADTLRWRDGASTEGEGRLTVVYPISFDPG